MVHKNDTPSLSGEGQQRGDSPWIVHTNTYRPCVELGEGLKKLEGRYGAIGMDICRQARTIRRRGYTRALERRTKLSGVKVLRDQEQHVVQREVSKPLQWLEDSVQEGRHAVVKKGGQAGSKD
jgi:hypothetical protein